MLEGNFFNGISAILFEKFIFCCQSTRKGAICTESVFLNNVIPTFKPHRVSLPFKTLTGSPLNLDTLPGEKQKSKW